MVLVHGNSLSNTIWKEQVNSASLSHLSLCAIDLSGHGRSERYTADKPYTLNGFAEEIAALIAGLEAPVLVGHSLGGHICMRVLAKAPNVRGLLLLGAPPLSSAADMARAFLPTAAMAFAFKPDLTEDEARTSAEVYTWPGSAWIAPMAEMILGTDPRIRTDLGAEIISGKWTDEQELIRQSGVPVCMVHGSEEPSISLDYLNGISPLFWKGRVHVLEGCGHSPQLQRPEMFNALLREFIAGL